MSERIEAALTPDQWAREITSVVDIEMRIGWACKEAGYDDEISPHALAALCLFEQPFGFTQEHVDFLRFIAHDEWNGEEMEEGRKLFAIASRIAALLPPPPSTETRPDE